MKLLVVESPTKAKTLVKYLSGFKIIASMGHIIDLPEDEIGVDLENEFAPSYVVIKGKEKTITQIKKEAAAADEIYIGSDPDREGEAIAYHIASLMKGGKEPRRVLFHEITKTGVIKAIENYTKLNEALYNSQQARRILDRIVGYKLSPFLWRSVKKGLSAGRVQSVALKLIVDRERDIRAFIPEEYWTIKGLFNKNSTISIEAQLESIDGEKKKVRNAADAGIIENRIKSAAYYQVSKIDKKKKTENPLPPFNTSTLQQEGSKTYHYTADRVMKLAQALYEGKEIGDQGPTGLITYMRTDSFRVSEESNAKLRGFVNDNYGLSYLCPFVRKYENKKGKVQDAHEAIRPTDIELTPDRVKPFLTKDEHNIYTLIWRRFVATQMKEAEFEVTTVYIEDDKKSLEFRKSGSVVVFEGFRKVYEKSTGNKDDIIPNMEEALKLALESVSLEQNFTKPPSRFTEGSLVKELEENGVGRPSTYATIINHIVLRKYVERLKEPKGALGSTELGELVSDTLQQFFPEIINVDFTAGMEGELDKIEEGEANWVAVLQSFYGKFADNLEKSFAGLKEKGKQKIFAEEPCPKCGKKLVLRWSKKTNQPFLSCEAYPDCDFSSDFQKDGEVIHVKASSQEAPALLDEKCPNCGSPLVIKNGKYGKFKACSAYPKCKTIVKDEEDLGPCPKDGCDGKVLKKRSKKGKVFYGCGNYPKCDFVSWYPPVKDEVCPKCGKKYIIEKKSGKSCQMCSEKI